MAYADAQTLQQKSAGIAGAALAHVALGGVILAGLSVTQVIPPIIDTGPMTPIDYTPKPPPPPPDPQPSPDTAPTTTRIVTPPRPMPLPDPFVLSDTTDTLPPLSDEITLTVPPQPIPNPGPSLGAIQPIAATPRNDPSRWVTDGDYKSRWIREELVGRATFRLDINANGKVENCSITRSTGHAVLDQATCSLISKRARFKPAKASDGSPTSGVYTSSIRWQLPD